MCPTFLSSSFFPTFLKDDPILVMWSLTHIHHVTYQFFLSVVLLPCRLYVLLEDNEKVPKAEYTASNLGFILSPFCALLTDALQLFCVEENSRYERRDLATELK